MGAIAFSRKTEESWVVAGWAFRQVLDDVASRYPEDLEMAKEFEGAKAIDGLILYTLDPEFAARTVKAIKQTVTGILSGAIRSGITDQRYGDSRTVEQYRDGLRQLLEAIPHET